MKKLIYVLIPTALLTLSISYWWLKPQPVALKQATFTQLPGWESTKITKSLLAFQVSCKTFLRQDPEQAVGSQHLNLKAKDWQPLCRNAMAIPIYHRIS